MQNDYEHFSPDDFLQDERFLDWLNNPQGEQGPFWESWLSAHPHKQAAVDEARQLHALLQTHEEITPAQGDREEVWDKIMAVVESESGERESGGWGIRQLRPLLKIAAVVLLLAGAAGVFLYNRNTQAPAAMALLESKDAVQRFLLPDSTIITLDQNSRCRYEKRMAGKTKREIWIDGEAFLDVSHRTGSDGKRQPFIVHMQGMDVEVLGTRFNVINRKAQKQVMLERGSVKVSSETGNLLLVPGEMAVTAGKDLVKKKINPALYTSWMTGVLAFDATSLQEVIDLLQYGFGYHVVFTIDPNKNKEKISGTVSLRNREDLFNTLAVAFGVSIKVQNNTLILSHKTD
ncbi:MAG TPA: FecR domain-containing protein [Flavisolibacter sp.]|nr:FecR domain-containing protein [Flavisolibacter sp.]